ncbi:pilus assembly protein TadG-related protein [Pseudomonas sp. 13B_2.1_Bac1]|uniref:pilus assembly protein TadG-related protein n=1 Tax=Pseudomonas sp. 13B_2.1_Bac1 TaxID=2971624 RepID=UPI0021CA6C02|nr:pilus assembly protein TadG-related protein [Pseudomonas sp. 13B_2.1_Bac1]MCU1787202.1 pilus assembly protein TadG-related protein [Pseudomonas sp. 13B_2.1_Bac1]
MSPRLGSRQRGAIGLMAAGTLAVALVFMLLAVDSGRLYMEKRRLQSIADTAALEAAGRGGLCTPSTTANDYAVQNATRNAFTVVAGDTSRGLAVTCGSLVTNASNVRVFTADPTKNDAVRVIATRSVVTSIASGLWNMFSGVPVSTQMTLSATAVAAYAPPVAQLTIRSSLVSVDSTKSPLLNLVIGNLLGGSLSITAAGWNGILQTNVNLLSYLNQLAINLGVTAGDYTTLLNTAVSATDLINAAVMVLQQNGSAVQSVVNDVLSIKAIAPNSKVLTVGSLLNVATGTPAAALNSSVQLFQLLETVAQLSNSKTAVSVATQVNIPVVGSVSIQTQVIQPPQMSAIGNPVLAKAGLANTPPTNQIFVRTAQVRTLVVVQAPILKVVSGVSSILSGLTTPVSKVVGGLLNLNLPAVVGGVLCLVACNVTDVDITQSLSIYIEAASAQSYVTDFTCTTPATKSLTVKTTTSLATLGVGYVDPVAAFSSKAPVSVQPIRLIDFGERYCVVLTLLCGPRTAGVGGGLNLMALSTVAAQTNSMVFLPVAEMNATPTYQNAPGTANIINSLGATLSGLQVTYVPPSGSTPGAANGTVTTALASIVSSVISLVQTVLAPVLDPIVNTLLSALGISLGNAEVGANLTCHMGRAYLVI